MAVEESGIDFPQFAIGGIVEGQIVVASEYGDPGRQLVEGAAMSFDCGRKVRPQRFQLGYVADIWLFVPTFPTTGVAEGTLALPLPADLSFPN